MPTDHGRETASPAASRKHPAEHFRYKGRQFRVFKRSADPHASWYLQLQRHGQRKPMSLGTASVKHAIAEAKLKIDLWDNEREVDLRRSMQRPADGRYSHIGDLFAAAPKVVIGVQPYVRMQYVRALRSVLSRALGTAPDEVDDLSCGTLNTATGERYFEWLIGAADRVENQADKNRLLLSGRQIFTFARALLQPRAIKGFRRLGLMLPDVEPFRSELKMARIHVASSKIFQTPNDAIVRRTFVEWIAIARTPGYELVGQGPLDDSARRNLFLDIGLELSCGLRAGDVRQARWNWFQIKQGQPRLCSNDINDKGKVGSINIRPLDPFWKVLNFWIDKNKWRGESDSLILLGNNPERNLHPFLNCSTWMRWLGWRTTRTGHALRDLAASLVTRKYGLHAAKLFCRHKKISTTESHYNSFVADVDDLDPKHSAWYHWAKL